MKNLLLICVLGVALTTTARDSQTTINEYLRGISSEALSPQDVVGTWVVKSNGYSGEMIEINANGKAFLLYKNCYGKMKEQVQVAFNGIALEISGASSVYFRKVNGEIYYFNYSLALEQCALFYSGVCERAELMEKLETCWLKVENRA